MNQKAFDHNANATLKGVRITYSIKHLPCSNPACLTCMTGNGHGPYWYASYVLDGQKKTVFLGRTFKPLDMAVLLKSHQRAKTPENPKPSPKAKVKPSEPVKRSTHTLKNAFPPLPNRLDFNQDLRILKGAAMSTNLKSIYRKLIKKYHPDQFAGNPQMDRWLSEINSAYKELL